jgi:hypothetical protein
MTEYQKFETLWSRFCRLADKGAAIITQYGSLHTCPVEKAREYIFLGKQQEYVQQELARLFERNGGRISC